MYIHLHLQNKQFSAFLTANVCLFIVDGRAVPVQSSVSDVSDKDTPDTFFDNGYSAIVKAWKAAKTTGI